jgi:hypothetical protein
MKHKVREEAATKKSYKNERQVAKNDTKTESK